MAKKRKPNAAFMKPMTPSAALAEVVGSKAIQSEEHTSELQSPCNLVCRLLLEKKKRHCHTCIHHLRCITHDAKALHDLGIFTTCFPLPRPDRLYCVLITVAGARHQSVRSLHHH